MLFRSNEFGVRIDIDSNNNISFIYSYTDDKRSSKSSIVPKNLQIEDLTIVRWDADYDESRTNTSTKKGLRLKVEEKYNKNGLCKCFREILENGELGAYSSIGFMDPMTFETFMGHFKTGDFYFDEQFPVVGRVTEISHLRCLLAYPWVYQWHYCSTNLTWRFLALKWIAPQFS